MDSFTRKNKLRLTVGFTATDGSGAEPTAAFCTVTYTRKNGKIWSEKFSLTKNPSTGKWSGLWDSKNAGPGEVEWNAECTGPLVGSIDGVFLLEANSANK